MFMNKYADSEEFLAVAFYSTHQRWLYLGEL